MTPPSKRIELEAARWAIRLRAGPLDRQEQAEFEAWCARSSRHQGALARARAGSAYVDRIAALAGKRPVQADQSSGPRHWAWRWLVAAGTTAFVLVAITGWFGWRYRDRTYVTTVGEMRQVELPDGSNLVLNTASQAVVRYRRARREVELLKGEVLLEVVHDVTRPFLVQAAQLTATVTGTAFSVRRQGTQVEVLVTQGSVEITHVNASGDEAPKHVGMNQRLVTQSGSVNVETINPQKAERLLSWRTGMVAFDGEPLSEAIAEINRYNHQQIVLDDPRLAARPIVGIFRATDVNTFVAAVADSYRAQVIVQGDVLRLQPRALPQ
jgi:transmembrane sensor